MAETLEKVTTAAVIANAAVFGWGLLDPLHVEMADAAEHVILAFFCGEMAWRWRGAGWRLAHWRGWRLFDLAVILVSVATVLPGTSVLRLARLARLAKLAHLGRHTVQLRLIALARN